MEVGVHQIENRANVQPVDSIDNSSRDKRDDCPLSRESSRQMYRSLSDVICSKFESQGMIVMRVFSSTLVPMKRSLHFWLISPCVPSPTATSIRSRTQ